MSFIKVKHFHAAQLSVKNDQWRFLVFHARVTQKPLQIKIAFTRLLITVGNESSACFCAWECVCVCICESHKCITTPQLWTTVIFQTTATTITVRNLTCPLVIYNAPNTTTKALRSVGQHNSITTIAGKMCDRMTTVRLNDVASHRPVHQYHHNSTREMRKLQSAT